MFDVPIARMDGREFLFRVNLRHPQPCPMSAAGGRAVEINTKTDIGQRMSPVGGQSDVPETWLEHRLIARSCHSLLFKWPRAMAHCDAGGRSRPLHQNRKLKPLTLPNCPLRVRLGSPWRELPSIPPCHRVQCPAIGEHNFPRTLRLSDVLVPVCLP